MNRRHSLSALALIAVLAAAACSSGERAATPPPSGSTADPATASPRGTDAAGPTGTGSSLRASATGRATGGLRGTTGSTSAADGADAAGDASVDLESVAAARDTAVVRVVYDVVDPTGSSRLLWSQDPPKLRIEDGLGLTVSDGTSAVTCPGPDRTPCTAVPVETAELAGTSGRGVIEFGLGLLDARDGLPPGLVRDAGERVIAGRQARCSSLDPALVGGFTGNGEAEPAEFCTDVATGWPLSADGAGLTLVAREFGTPAAGDFVLP